MISAYLKTYRKNPFQALLASFILVLLFSSCQKEYEVTGDIGPANTTPTTPATPSVTANKVKTYTEDVTYANGTKEKMTFNLTYDGSDRLLSLVSTANAGDKFVYKYNTDNSYTMDIYNANTLVLHEVFFINSLSFVDSTLQYDNLSKDTTTEKYLYNANKQLVTLKNYDYAKATGAKLSSTTNYTYDSNGNLVKEIEGSTTTTYDYYPDFLNNLWVGLIYYYQSKNLIKTTTETSGSSTPDIINHTYTFDSNNRITSEKNVYSDGHISIRSYTY